MRQAVITTGAGMTASIRLHDAVLRIEAESLGENLGEHRGDAVDALRLVGMHGSKQGVRASRDYTQLLDDWLVEHRFDKTARCRHVTGLCCRVIRTFLDSTLLGMNRYVREFMPKGASGFTKFHAQIIRTATGGKPQPRARCLSAERSRARWL